jgi:hypothetical protein
MLGLHPKTRVYLLIGKIMGEKNKKLILGREAGGATSKQ